MPKSKATKIDPERWYSLSEIANERLFPWCRNIATYRRYILADRQANNFLKAVIMGQGRAKTYRIKGENIIKYLAEVDEGTLQV